MSRSVLPAQHLSDEAVAAFADGVLGATARARAERHIAGCPECAYAVAVQREAVWALRHASAPPLPTGLIDRLRAVPATTPLNQRPLALGPDGAAEFPAFGTSVPTTPDAPMASMSPTGSPGVHRHAALGLVALAAVVAAGTLSTTAVSASGHSPGPVPPPVRVQPAGYVSPVGPATMLPGRADPLLDPALAPAAVTIEHR